MRQRKTGWVFARVSIGSICDPNLSDGALRLLAYLAWRQGDDTVCWPSVARVATDLGSSRSTVRRRLRELEEAGYLTTTHRQGRSSHYSLVTGADDEVPQGEPETRRDVAAREPRASEGARPEAPTPTTSDGGPPSDLTDTRAEGDGGPPSRPMGTPVRSDGHDERQGRENGEREERDEAFLAQWSRTLEALRLQMTRATFELWFASAAARRHGQTLCVGLPSQRAQAWVSQRLHSKVLATVRRVFEEPNLSVVYEAR